MAMKCDLAKFPPVARSPLMTAKDLLAALEGVPDEALPMSHWREELRLMMDEDAGSLVPNAAVGKMTVWLCERSCTLHHLPLGWSVRMPKEEPADGFSDTDLRYTWTPTVDTALAALAQACRSIAGRE